MHPAALWKALPDGRVSCRLCSHFCRIAPGRRGLCGVRENRDGALFTLVHDRVAAVNLDPVEKKPLYHFLPGTTTFSFGTMGCNLSCAFCQNAGLSQPPRQGKAIAGETVDPAGLVAAAKRSGAASVSYTYSEPTVFYELMADTADLAQADGLKNIMVSNGFMSRACLDALGGRIDAANIDLKAFTEEFYHRQCLARLGPVLDTLCYLKRETDVWIEVTTLLIPGENDSPDEIARAADWFAENLGPDVPWHFSAFHPAFRLLDKPRTPPETLFRARARAMERGLRYVYTGNIRDREGSTTFCPGCRHPVIVRDGYRVTRMDLRGPACARCGTVVAGRFE